MTDEETGSGLISIRADDNKNITSYDYDGLGRVLKTTVEDSADKTDGKLTTTIWRDALGNVTQLVDPFGLKTQSRYDEAGLIEFNRTEQAEVYADGQTHRGVFFKTQFSYNTAGLVETRTHSRGGDTLPTIFYGNGTTFEYDSLGRVTKQTQQLNSQQHAVTEFQYDVFGVLKWLKDANKNETTFVLDNLGRTTQEATELGTRSYDYDSFGNLLQLTDRNGKTIQFSYGNLGRRTREQWLGDGADGYVADFMFTQLGELAEAKNSDVSGVISEYDYDYGIARRRQPNLELMSFALTRFGRAIPSRRYHRVARRDHRISRALLASARMVFGIPSIRSQALTFSHERNDVIVLRGMLVSHRIHLLRG